MDIINISDTFGRQGIISAVKCCIDHDVIHIIHDIILPELTCELVDRPVGLCHVNISQVDRLQPDIFCPALIWIVFYLEERCPQDQTPSIKPFQVGFDHNSVIVRPCRRQCHFDDIATHEPPGFQSLQWSFQGHAEVSGGNLSTAATKFTRPVDG